MSMGTGQSRTVNNAKPISRGRWVYVCVCVVKRVSQGLAGEHRLSHLEHDDKNIKRNQTYLNSGF
jgi:hypothetical protein